jgi:hypothetical protein
MLIQILKYFPPLLILKLQLLSTMSSTRLRCQELYLKKLSQLTFLLYNVIQGYVLKYENIYLVNQHYKIRHVYRKTGPYKFTHSISSRYLFSGIIKKKKKKKALEISIIWCKIFHWLEYSFTKDVAYCLPFYLFW